MASDGRTALAELKRHSRTSFHRATQQETTGIEERYWQDYLAVSACTGLPIFIAFEHDEGPPGFIGGEVLYLRSRVSHRHSGMIFWSVAALRRIQARDDLGFLPDDMRPYPDPPDDFDAHEARSSGIADLDFGGFQP